MSAAQLGTYAYWCAELTAFLRTCDERELSPIEAESAMKALAYVWTRTEEPADLCDRINFHQGFNIALRRLGVEAGGLPRDHDRTRPGRVRGSNR